MVGASTQTSLRPSVSPAAPLGSAGHPTCDPVRKLKMRRSLSCIGVGAPIAPLSLKDPDDALGRRWPDITVGIREAPPFWPRRSFDGTSACSPALPPIGHVAVSNTAGCSMPGGALAGATPAAESHSLPARGDGDLRLRATWWESPARAVKSSLGVPGSRCHSAGFWSSHRITPRGRSTP